LTNTILVHNTVAEVVYGYGPAAPLCYLRVVAHHFSHDEATMNLILAFSSFAWSSLIGKNRKYERKGLVLMTKGIQLVNQTLQDAENPVSESIIQAAIVMSAIEVRLKAINWFCGSSKHLHIPQGRAGNFHAFKTHLSGARQMVKMLGGLDRLSTLLLWQICS